MKIKFNKKEKEEIKESPKKLLFVAITDWEYKIIKDIREKLDIKIEYGVLTEDYIHSSSEIHRKGTNVYKDIDNWWYVNCGHYIIKLHNPSVQIIS